MTFNIHEKQQNCIINFFSCWGFQSWEWHSIKGITRQVSFIKSALLGEVARYYAEDTIVLDYSTAEQRRLFWNTVRAKPDVASQRFLFILKAPQPTCIVRSFFLGFKGTSEYHTYWPGQKINRRIHDLIYLLNNSPLFK